MGKELKFVAINEFITSVSLKLPWAISGTRRSLPLLLSEYHHYFKSIALVGMSYSLSPLSISFVMHHYLNACNRLPGNN